MNSFRLRTLVVLTFTCLSPSAFARPTPALAPERPSTKFQLLPRYTVTALTTGWTTNAAFAINENGAAVGQDHLRGFAWIPNSPNSTQGTTKALPSLAPDATAAGYGIDGSNNVVGYSRDAASRPNPVRWLASGNYTTANLLTLRDGTVGGQGFAVNASGVAVGATGWTATDMNVARWNTDGSLDDLGKPAGAQYAFARAINAAGTIAGAAQVGGNQIAFRYSNGQYQMLPLPGSSPTSDVHWINNSGIVVGSANGAWWSDGETSQYLSLVPGVTANRAANGINDKGVVVGTAVTGTQGNVPVGTIWFDRAARGYMLNDLIDQSTSAGYLVRDAYAINNRGQIAVQAITPAGAYVAALLTPTGWGSAVTNPTLSAVPEPGTLAIVGVAAIAMRRRRAAR